MRRRSIFATAAAGTCFRTGTNPSFARKSRTCWSWSATFTSIPCAPGSFPTWRPWAAAPGVGMASGRERRSLRGQVTGEILQLFSNDVPRARQLYRQFVADGVEQGHREELVGGGLRRSSQLAGVGKEEEEAFLTNGCRAAQILSAKFCKSRAGGWSCRSAPRRNCSNQWPNCLRSAAEVLRRRERSRPVAEARSLFCYFAVREMGMSGEAGGRMLNISRAAVSFAAGRGEVLASEDPTLREKIATPDARVGIGGLGVVDLTT